MSRVNVTHIIRFLHDVITAVINDTGTLSGLFDGSEMNSDNVKVRLLKTRLTISSQREELYIHTIIIKYENFLFFHFIIGDSEVFILY